jgi:sulfur transfer protein SufE
MIRPKGGYSNMTEEHWLAYGKANCLDKLSRTEMQKAARTYYLKGMREGWIAELIPETKCKPRGFFKNMNLEQWLHYGRNNGFDKLGRKELKYDYRAYYRKGTEEKWIAELIPKTKIKHNFYSSMTKEQWFAYGMNKRFNALSRTELQNEDYTYYLKGLNEGWTAELIPETKCKPKKSGKEGCIGELISETKRRYRFYIDMTKEQWLAYGRENGFNKLNRTKLQQKASKYYKKGIKEGWISELVPETARKPNGFYSHMTKEQWMKFGQDNSLNLLSITELEKKCARYYTKGLETGWVWELIPNRKVKPNGFFSNMTKEQWIAYGKKNNLDKLGRGQLGKKHVRFYAKGRLEGWVSEFIPETEHKPNGFFSNMTKEQWIAYGRENGFDRLNSRELSKKTNRFYKKGCTEGWINNLIAKSNSLEQTVDMYIGAGK